MRVVLVLTSLIVALYYYAPAATVLGPVVAAFGTAVAAVGSVMPRSGRATEEALASERNRSNALDAEVAALRQQLSLRDTERAGREVSLASAAAATEQASVELGLEKRRADALAARADALAAEVTEARRTAQSQGEAARAQRDEQQARAAERDRVRAELDVAVADQRRMQAALQAAEAEARTQARQVADAQQRAAALAEETATQRRDAATEIAALRATLETAQARAAASERAAADATAAADAAQHPAQTSATVAERPAAIDPADRREAVPAAPDDLLAARYALPDATRLRVAVSYQRDSEAAQSHAVKIAQFLQTKGVSIVGLDVAALPIAGNGMAFYYDNDHGAAARIGDLLPEFRSNVRRSVPGTTIPRPGVIQVDVAS